MPKMYCQVCGKYMGNHKYHDKGTCRDCKKKLYSYTMNNGENLLRSSIEIDEKSRTWEDRTR